MGEDDIELDVSLIGTSRDFRQYKADGGFLDKLTYFEVLSQVRESRNAPAPYQRKVKYARVTVADTTTLLDESGQEYVLESGDQIEAVEETNE